MRGRGWLLVVLFAARVAVAQSSDQSGGGSGNESRIHADFRREWLELHPCREQAVKPCSTFTFGHLTGIAQTLFTGQPLHIALGSLAPQNGFASGLAFVEHEDFPSEWRLTFNTDAVATGNGSWRAGGYVKAFKLGGGKISVVEGPGQKQAPFFHVAPLSNLYAETTSLNHVDYYGLGPDTLPGNKAAFGLTETIIGGSAIVPVGWGGVSLFAELNGRVPSLRGNHGESVPSIEQNYNEASAPGLTSQPVFVQPGVGVRVQPSILGGYLRLHYLLKFEDFAAPGNSTYSFRRWTTDFGHEFPLDRKVHLTAASDQNGPDSCTSNPATRCPSPTHVSNAINHEGSIDFRLLMSGSAAGAGSVTPFLFRPYYRRVRFKWRAYAGELP